MQLLIGMSMRRYLPAIGTAGFERILVRGCKRDPRPPPIITPSTSFIDGIANLHDMKCDSRSCECNEPSQTGAKPLGHMSSQTPEFYSAIISYIVSHN